MSKANRLGNRQKNALIDLVEEHFEFIQGKHATARGANDKKASWLIISDSVNMVGPISKTAEQWLKTWNSLTYKVKEKLKMIRNHKNCTGMGPLENEDVNESDATEITECDWRIINMCNLEILDGHTEVECGFNLISPSPPVRPQSPQPSTSRMNEPPYISPQILQPSTSEISIISHIPLASPTSHETRGHVVELLIEPAEYLQGYSSPLRVAIQSVHTPPANSTPHLVNVNTPPASRSHNNTPRPRRVRGQQRSSPRNPTIMDSIQRSLRLQEEQNKQQRVIIQQNKNILKNQQELIKTANLTNKLLL